MSPKIDSPPLHPRVEGLRADDVQRDMEVWNRLPPGQARVNRNLLHDDGIHMIPNVQYDRFSAWVHYRATRSRVGGSPFVDLRHNRARYTESSVEPNPHGIFPTRDGPPMKHFSARQIDELLARSRAVLDGTDGTDGTDGEQPKIWTQEEHDAFLVAHEKAEEEADVFIKAFEAKLAARNAAASSKTANATVDSDMAAAPNTHSIAQQKQYQAEVKLDEHAQTPPGKHEELDKFQGIVEDSVQRPAQAANQLDEQSQVSEGLHDASEESVEQHARADERLGEHVQTLRGKDEEISRLQKLINELRSQKLQAENQLVEQTRAMRSQDEKLVQLQNRCAELEAKDTQAEKKLDEQDKELKKLSSEHSAALSRLELALVHKHELEIAKLGKNAQAQTDSDNRHSDNRVIEEDARGQSLSDGPGGETELMDVSSG